MIIFTQKESIHFLLENDIFLGAEIENESVF